MLNTTKSLVTLPDLIAVAPDTEIKLSPKQQEGFDEIMHFFLNSKRNGFVFSGVAGSGKTTIIKNVVDILQKLRYRVMPLAFTGRAAATMRDKGIFTARTIHSFIYKPIYDPELNDVIGFELRPKREVKEQTDFLIVDEAGMVGKALYDDLLSFGIPILFVGDKEQLPPVDSTAKGFNVMDAASVHLTEIHRQAEGNPIIALSRHIRENGTFDRKLAGNEIIYMRKTGITKNFLQNNTINVTLCGTNKTRLSLNRLARAAYGFDDDRAQQGEIVIGLKNMGLVNNGERFMVVSVAATKYKHAEYTLSSDSTTSIFTVKVPDECWFEEPVHINRGKNPDWAVMTYGYAITVYKSQGSEFDNVLYVDEDVSYFVDQRKFRYTAVTRAKQRVFIAT